MRFIVVFLFILFCINTGAQDKALFITTNEKLTQAFGQALLPITINIKPSNQPNINLTFFDIVYLKNNNETEGKFLAAAKPGTADLVRHKPILIRSINTNEELIKNILENPISPDTVILASINGNWSNGIINFKVTDVKVVSKNLGAIFNELFIQQIKSSKKLNFSIPTKNVVIKQKNNKKLPLIIRPFFAEDYIGFTVAPQKLYSFSQLRNSMRKFNSQVNFSNNSIEINYDLLNYIAGYYYPKKEVRVKKEDLNFVFSRFKIIGNTSGAMVTCQVKSIETQGLFDAKVNLARDMLFQNCNISPRTPDIFLTQAAKMAERKINEKFSNKYFVEEDDFSQVFPFKLRGSKYKLFIDIRKIYLKESSVELFNEIFIEKQ